MQGASGFDAERCLDAIAQYQPDSLILLPQMLQALVTHLAAASGRGKYTRSLKFVAVGGSRTSPHLIRKARTLGLPVYEGYGLTECASVVSINVPGADRINTVGRTLPGVSLRIAPDSEIEVSGRTSAGYLGEQPNPAGGWLKTGDLGTVDASGFISIVGRKKHVIITSYGRNVSPEWPEQLLLESSFLTQAVVYGNDRPFLTAVLVPASRELDDAAIESHVEQVNRRLPDYARIGGWVRAVEPCTYRNGLATTNGRLRRDMIQLVYGRHLDALYRHAEASSRPEQDCIGQTVGTGAD